MARKHAFSEDPRTGKAEKLTGPDLDRQIARHRSTGRTVTVMDDDERINMALLTQQLIKGQQGGNR